MKFPLVIAAALLFTPAALASETAADCEADQWWIGYHATRPIQLAAEDTLAGAPAALATCEGEQWDGQDSVQPSRQSSCAGSVDPTAPFVGYCLGRDPNTAPSEDPIQPLGVRASGKTGGGAHEAYLAVNVAFVGRVAFYGGTCESGAGLEGEGNCRGSREARTGVYARDNTPGNIVMTTVECFASRVTCFASEADCTHEAYTYGAQERIPICSRDNTAIGTGIVLA